MVNYVSLITAYSKHLQNLLQNHVNLSIGYKVNGESVENLTIRSSECRNIIFLTHWYNACKILVRLLRLFHMTTFKAVHRLELQIKQNPHAS